MEEGMVQLYLNAAVQGVPLLFLVWGLVEWLKRFKTGDAPALSGNALLVASLLIGAIIGCGYVLYKTPPDVTLAGWALYSYCFGAVGYGMVLGILASLFHNTIEAVVRRTIGKVITIDPEQ